MKIAFINPYCENSEVMHRCPPYGILSLMAFLKKELEGRIEMRYFDDFLESDIKRSISQFSPDVIGISSNTPTIVRAYALADELRKSKMGTVILGGKHPSGCPQESLAHADYVIAGEGEQGLAQFIKNFLRGEKPLERFLASQALENLDLIPALPWDILDFDYYVGEDSLGRLMRFDRVGRSIGLLTSRGCPFRCMFCYNSKKRSKVRYFSAQRVISDIEEMLIRRNIDSIFFFDDEFFSNKARLEKICELIQDKKLKFRWACQARTDVVDPATLKRVKEAGCVQISYGFESGSPKILRMLKGAHVTIESNKRAIQMTRREKIRVFGNFILGTPTETIKDFLMTLYFALSQPLDIVATSIATAYPATQLWDYCVENKIFDPSRVDYRILSLQKNTYYLNQRHMPKFLFNFLFFIYRGLVFVFRKDYSGKEICIKIINRIKALFLRVKVS